MKSNAHASERLLRIFDPNWAEYEHARLFAPTTSFTEARIVTKPIADAQESVEGILPPSQMSDAFTPECRRLLVDSHGIERAFNERLCKRVALLEAEVVGSTTTASTPLSEPVGEPALTVPVSVQWAVKAMFPLIDNSSHSESEALQLKLKVIAILRDLLLGSTMQVLRPESSDLVKRYHQLLQEALLSLKDSSAEADEERRQLVLTLVGLGLHYNSFAVLLQVATTLVTLAKEHPTLRLSFAPFAPLLNHLRTQAGVGRILFSETSRKESFTALWSSSEFCPLLSRSEDIASVTRPPIEAPNSHNGSGIVMSRTPSSASRLGSDWSVVRVSSVSSSVIPTPSVLGSIATDGSFLYARIGTSGLVKLGTGQSETIRGHVYAFNQNFLPHLHVWLACVGERLFARTRFMLDCFVHDVDTATLSIISPVATIGPLPKRFCFGDIADIFSDGQSLYAVERPLVSDIATVARAGFCTFSVTSNSFTRQHWFNCRTCTPKDNQNVGCCGACAHICHGGHDVVLAKNSPSKFFCDCGAGELCPDVACKTMAPGLVDLLHKSRSRKARKDVDVHVLTSSAGSLRYVRQMTLPSSWSLDVPASTSSSSSSSSASRVSPEPMPPLLLAATGTIFLVNKRIESLLGHDHVYSVSCEAHRSTFDKTPSSAHSFRTMAPLDGPLCFDSKHSLVYAWSQSSSMVTTFASAGSFCQLDKSMDVASRDNASASVLFGFRCLMHQFVDIAFVANMNAAPSPLLFSAANFEEVVRGMHCLLVALLGAPSTEGIRSSNLMAGEVQYCLQAFSRLFSCAGSQLGSTIASLPPSEAAISQLRLLLEQLALEGQSCFNLPSPCNALAAEVLASGLHILYRTPLSLAELAVSRVGLQHECIQTALTLSSTFLSLWSELSDVEIIRARSRVVSTIVQAEVQRLVIEISGVQESNAKSSAFSSQRVSAQMRLILCIEREAIRGIFEQGEPDLHFIRVMLQQSQHLVDVYTTMVHRGVPVSTMIPYIASSPLALCLPPLLSALSHEKVLPRSLAIVGPHTLARFISHLSSLFTASEVAPMPDIHDSIPEGTTPKVSTKTVESMHPMTRSAPESQVVKFDSASALRIEFDRRCHTSRSAGVLSVKSPGSKITMLFGGNSGWPTEPLLLRGDSVRIAWLGSTSKHNASNGSRSSDRNSPFGFRIVVSPVRLQAPPPTAILSELMYSLATLSGRIAASCVVGSPKSPCELECEAWLSHPLLSGGPSDDPASFLFSILDSSSASSQRFRRLCDSVIRGRPLCSTSAARVLTRVESAAMAALMHCHPHLAALAHRLVSDDSAVPTDAERAELVKFMKQSFAVERWALHAGRLDTLFASVCRAAPRSPSDDVFVDMDVHDAVEVLKDHGLVVPAHERARVYSSFFELVRQHQSSFAGQHSSGLEAVAERLVSRARVLLSTNAAVDLLVTTSTLKEKKSSATASTSHEGVMPRPVPDTVNLSTVVAFLCTDHVSERDVTYEHVIEALRQRKARGLSRQRGLELVARTIESVKAPDVRSMVLSETCRALQSMPHYLSDLVGCGPETSAAVRDSLQVLLNVVMEFVADSSQPLWPRLRAIELSAISFTADDAPLLVSSAMLSRMSSFYRQMSELIRTRLNSGDQRESVPHSTEPSSSDSLMRTWKSVSRLISSLIRTVVSWTILPEVSASVQRVSDHVITELVTRLDTEAKLVASMYSSLSSPSSVSEMMACEESCYDLLKLVYRLGSSSPSLRSAKLLRAPLALCFVGTLRIRRLSIRLVRLLVHSLTPAEVCQHTELVDLPASLLQSIGALLVTDTQASPADVEMVPAPEDADEEMATQVQNIVPGKNRLFSVVVRLPENMSVDVLIDERYHHVFQYAKLKRAQKGVQFSSWLARTRRSLKEHGEAVMVTASRKHCLMFASELAQAGLVSHIVEQDDNPLSRNLAQLQAGNPRPRMGGSSALALQCDLVYLLRDLICSSNWTATVNETLLDALAFLGSVVAEPSLSDASARSPLFLSSLAALLVLSDNASFLRRGAAVSLGNETGTIVSLSPHTGKAKVVLSSVADEANGKIDSVEVPVTDLLPERTTAVFQHFRCTPSSLRILLSCVKFFERCHASEKEPFVSLMLGSLGSAAMSALAAALEESLSDAKSNAASVLTCFEELMECLRPISQRSTVAVQARALHWHRQQALATCLDSLVDEASGNADERNEADSDMRTFAREETNTSMVPYQVCTKQCSSPLPVCFCEWSAPNVFFLSDQLEVQFSATQISAQHALLSNEDGLPNVSSVIVTPDTSIPVANVRQYYFEVTLECLPSSNGFGIGFRSSRHDFFVVSNGTKWQSSRSAFDRQFLRKGMYIDAQDTAQRPAHWEPSRVIDQNDSKVKVGWLYWEGPDYQQWIDRSSELLAPFLSHTSGAVPLAADRQISPSSLSESVTGSAAMFQRGDVIGCGFDATDGSMFVTKNGVVLGTVFNNLPMEDFSPGVELRVSGTRVLANFGATPFRYDIASRSPGGDESMYSNRVAAFQQQQLTQQCAEERENRCRTAREEQKAARRYSAALEILGMFPGCTEAQLMRALEINGDDASRTVNWAFEQPDPLEALRALVQENPVDSSESSEQRPDFPDSDNNLESEGSSHVAASEHKFDCTDLCVGISYQFVDDIQGGSSSDVRGNEDSEEVRVWLSNIESSLRRARMDPVAIERVVNRLKRDNRDVVALLQAREIIPSLPDAPTDAREEIGTADADETRQYVPSLEEIEEGDVVLVAKNVTEELQAQNWWLPQMSAVVGSVGTVLEVDADTLPALVLLRFVDSERSSVQDWWLPCEVLRVHPRLPSSLTGSDDPTACLKAIEVQSVEYGARRALQSLVCHLTAVSMPRGPELTHDLRLELLQACIVHALGKRDETDIMHKDSVMALPMVVNLFDDVDALFVEMLHTMVAFIERHARIITLGKASLSNKYSAPGASMISCAVFQSQVQSLSPSSNASLLFNVDEDGTNMLKRLPLTGTVMPVLASSSELSLQLCGDSISELDVVLSPISWHHYVTIYLLQARRCQNGKLLPHVLQALALKWMPPTTKLQLLRIAAELALLPGAAQSVSVAGNDLHVQHLVSQAVQMHRALADTELPSQLLQALWELLFQLRALSRVPPSWLSIENAAWIEESCVTADMIVSLAQSGKLFENLATPVMRRGEKSSGGNAELMPLETAAKAISEHSILSSGGDDTVIVPCSDIAGVHSWKLHVTALQSFNRKLELVFFFSDLRLASQQHASAHALASCRGIIVPDIKLKFLETVLNATGISPVKRQPVPIHIDRITAAVATTPDQTIFEQGMPQVLNADACALRPRVTPDKNKGVELPLVIRLRGEKVVGSEGPYRAFFADICSELQAPRERDLHSAGWRLGVLVPCPNAQHGTGGNQEKMVFATSPGNLRACRFIGRLMGVAVRTSVRLALDLPELFWRRFVGEDVNIEHLRAIDHSFVEGVLQPISTCRTAASFKALFPSSLHFVISLSDGTEVELVNNGSNRRVTFEERERFSALALQARLDEGIEQVEAVRSGFDEIIPPALLSLFTGRDAERLVCGETEVDLALLKRHTQYGGGLSDESRLVKDFWAVLKEFSNDMRRKFLDFVYGQGRLPSEDEFTRLRIRLFVSPLKGDGDPDKRFPHSDTCFFNLRVPMYSSIDVLRDRLTSAIRMGSGFGELAPANEMD